jgi:peptidoglycan/xylan/chitin deacetylase (PgdA/CDA1 family)
LTLAVAKPVEVGADSREIFSPVGQKGPLALDFAGDDEPDAALLMRPVLVRRGYVCDYEVGERPLPAPDALLRRSRPGLLPLSSVACVATDERVVALTYDDGPDPEQTPGVLDALAEAGARATFFVLMDRAASHPELIRRILADGHEIGLHGEDHTRLTTLPVRESLRRIRRGKRRLEELTGQPVTLFRPPYGAQTLAQAVGTRATGLEVVLWTAWARDWEEAPAIDIAARSLAALHTGGFLLLHDATGDLAPPPGPAPTFDRGEVTRRLLAGMAGSGWTSDGVGTLLGRYPAVRTFWAARRASGREAPVLSGRPSKNGPTGVPLSTSAVRPREEDRSFSARPGAGRARS